MVTQVGVGVLVTYNNKILLGERINAHGSGTWSPPGGHLEFKESPELCARRELEEETGLVAQKTIIGPWSNDVFQEENKHYISLFIIVPEFQGEVSVKEPHKCLKWAWFDFDQLPKSLFLPLSNLVRVNSLMDVFSRSSSLEV